MSDVAAPDAHRLARRAGLPELPHRHRAAEQRRAPLHQRLRRRRQRARRRSTRPSRPTPTRPPPASRCTASRPATAACSARPVTARRTPSFRARSATTTCRASRCRATSACSPSAPPATPQSPQTVDGGPHGMHPVGAAWVERHPDVAEEGGAQRCRACHGADYRGTVLSRAKGDRTLDHRLRHQAVLARLPDRLLHLPSRPGNGDRAIRTGPPVVDDARGVDHRRRPGRRSRSRPAMPTATRWRCASSSQPAHGTRRAQRHDGALFPGGRLQRRGPVHVHRLGRLHRRESRHRWRRRRRRRWPASATAPATARSASTSSCAA